MSITLAPFKKNVYLSLDVLIKIINKHVAIEDYAVIRERSKRFKKSVIMKAFVKCDVYNEIKFIDNGVRNISSRKKNC